MSDANANIGNNAGPVSFLTGKGIVPQILLAIAVCAVIYMVMLMGEVIYKSYLGIAKTRTEIIPVTVSSQDKVRMIEQNPFAKNSKNLPMSDNERSGAEFTYSFFIWVNPQTFNDQQQLAHVFHKGNPFYIPLMGPGVFMRTNENTMRVYMNSTQTWNNYCDVPNFPVKKWVHVGIVARNNTVEVYVNGNIAKKMNMDGGVLYQNFGNLYLFSQRTCERPSTMPSLNGEAFRVSGAYNGSLSRLVYFNYALSYTEISAIVAEGPSSQTESSNQDAPPYLTDSWWTTSYTSM